MAPMRAVSWTCDNEAINYGGRVAYDLVTSSFAELVDPEKK